MAMNRRTAALVALAMALPRRLFGWARNVRKARELERCSDKIKFDKMEDFDRLGVRSKLDKIIQELQFSTKDFDIKPLSETRDLAAKVYIAAFLVSSKGDKAAKDMKATLFESFRESTKKWIANIGELSAEDQAQVETWTSKNLGMMSRVFDQGREDGGKPCPERPKPKPQP